MNSKQIPGISRRELFEGALSFGAFAAMSTLPLTAAADTGPLSGSDIARRSQSLAKGIEKAFSDALQRSTAKYPLGQAGAILHVLSNIQLGLSMNYFNADPARPTLFNYMNSHVKQGGDNADSFYSGFAVDYRNTYRIHGKFGSAKYVSFTTVERDESSPWGGRMGAGLYNHEMEIAEDGSFEVIVSAKPHKGNWLKITERDFRITIRQFFSDWENERPMRATVEVVGESAIPPIEMTAEHIMSSMEKTIEWLGLTVNYWQSTMDLFRRHPNQFVNWRTITGDRVNAAPGGNVACGYWNVPRGKALILRTTPPECRYWNVEFNNPWWETMDYRFHLSGTNDHFAVREDNGEVIIVISHEDPGVPNWLDTCGHTEGMMGRRWMFAKTEPDVETILVDSDKLFDHLPKNVRRITPQERKAQLESRLRGLYNRFVTL